MVKNRTEILTKILINSIATDLGILESTGGELCADQAAVEGAAELEGGVSEANAVEVEAAVVGAPRAASVVAVLVAGAVQEVVVVAEDLAVVVGAVVAGAVVVGAVVAGAVVAGAAVHAATQVVAVGVEAAVADAAVAALVVATIARATAVAMTRWPTLSARAQRRAKPSRSGSRWFREQALHCSLQQHPHREILCRIVEARRSAPTASLGLALSAPAPAQAR